MVSRAYTLKRSTRARRMRLSVCRGGEVVVTAPISGSEQAIREFVRAHEAWIAKAVRRMKNFLVLPVFGAREYAANKEAARAFAHERLAHWNALYRFSFGQVAIKDTATLWGSCSRKCNLNFSYKLLFLPRELADYIVVHELCHLRERNHSPAFWSLVMQAIPDYAARRRELRRYVLK